MKNKNKNRTVYIRQIYTSNWVWTQSEAIWITSVNKKNTHEDWCGIRVLIWSGDYNFILTYTEC